MAGKEGTTERKVAVITGASSGIGRATALQFADSDYNVVLAARRMDELREVARQCEEAGVETLCVATDVSDEGSVQALCADAVETFGRIDAWVNNAGVYIAGNFLDTPSRDMKRLMDVNFFGYVYGSNAALAQFRKQGYGTLINVSSVNAAAPQPYVGIYSASKAAIRALDESIRMELKVDGLDETIHVCTVMPAAVDTNLFQNAANYTGHKLQAIEPVYDPEYVAKHIYAMTEKPKRAKFVGPAGTFMMLQNAHIRPLYEKQMGVFTHSDLLSEEEAAVDSGNLFEPVETNRGTRGGWREKRMRADKLNITLGAVTAAAIGLIGLGLLSTRKMRS